MHNLVYTYNLKTLSTVSRTFCVVKINVVQINLLHDVHIEPQPMPTWFQLAQMKSIDLAKQCVCCVYVRRLWMVTA